jgi:hypothetical protein
LWLAASRLFAVFVANFDGELAWDSTPLLACLRGKKGDREIA